MKFHHRWAVTVLIVIASSVSTLSHAAAVNGQGSWETTLQGRDLDGNLATAEAYYSTSLGITWLADANYAQTSGYDADGFMTWSVATAWAASLNPYGSGITGWQLPVTNPVSGIPAPGGYQYGMSYNGSTDVGYNQSAPYAPNFAGSPWPQMAHMYYLILGNKSPCDPAISTVSSCSPQPGYGLTNTGPFSNVRADYYWSATEYAPITSRAWVFGFDSSFQTNGGKDYGFYAWAVHSGDVGAAVSTVPVPAAAWLFGSGLLGLIGVARCRKAAV
jgi:hypothetical protein